MNIDKYEKTGKGKYRLYLDNGEVLDTYDNVILKNDLLLKKTLDNNKYNKIIEDNTKEEAYNNAFKYISIRKRSTKEIRDYLKRKNTNEDIIEEVMLRLTKEKLLNDEEYTQAFIKDKLRFTTMGEYKIINELKRQGISSDIINKYSHLMSEDILLEKITKLIEKQIKNNHKYDNKTLRNKIYINLLNSGYSSELITKVLNSYLN